MSSAERHYCSVAPTGALCAASWTLRATAVVFAANRSPDHCNMSLKQSAAKANCALGHSATSILQPRGEGNLISPSCSPNSLRTHPPSTLSHHFAYPWRKGTPNGRATTRASTQTTDATKQSSLEFPSHHFTKPKSSPSLGSLDGMREANTVRPSLPPRALCPLLPLRVPVCRSSYSVFQDYVLFRSASQDAERALHREALQPQGGLQ